VTQVSQAVCRDEDRIALQYTATEAQNKTYSFSEDGDRRDDSVCMVEMGGKRTGDSEAALCKAVFRLMLVSDCRRGLTLVVRHTLQ